jgi:hypothetical protein
MKSVNRWLMPMFLVLVVMSAQNARNPAAAQPRKPVGVMRIYTGPDGQTHAEQVDVRLAASPVIGREQSEAVKATSSYFVRLPAGFFQDWHPAAERRYLVTLSGRGEIELAHGQKIVLERGRVLLAEDVTGKGHITRTLGKEDWTALFVQLDQ